MYLLSFSHFFSLTHTHTQKQGRIDNLTGHAVCTAARFDLERRLRQCPSAICLSVFFAVAIFFHHHYGFSSLPFSTFTLYISLHCDSHLNNPSFSSCVHALRFLPVCILSRLPSKLCLRVCLNVHVHAILQGPKRDQKQACVSAAQYMARLHSHSALGGSVWA